MKRIALGLLALVAVAGCTPRQIAVWQQWHADDPAAAMEFLETPEFAELSGAAEASSGASRGEQVQMDPQPPPPPDPEPGRGVWDRLAQCESGGNWSINTGNGYFGGLQFSMSSWRAVGGTGRPDQNSRAEQIRRAERLKSIQGWGAWPACSRKLGLR